MSHAVRRAIGLAFAALMLGLVGVGGYLMALVTAGYGSDPSLLHVMGFVVVPVALLASYMVWFTTRPPAMQRRIQRMTIPPIAVVSGLYWTWEAVQPGLSVGRRGWLLLIALPLPLAAVVLVREARQEAARARLAAADPPAE
jgi:hypothetical protein